MEIRLTLNLNVLHVHACPFCCGFNLQNKGAYHPKPGNLGYSTHLLSQYSYWLFFYFCCDHGSTTASLIPAPYIPDIWLETCGRYYLYEIGFLMVAGCLCMAGFQWKLNLWIWCSGVWLMNCFGRNQCQLGCLPLGWSGLGSEIWDHSDYGKSNEAMNFCLEWSHPFIWSTMIQVISDHLSSSGSSQVNPLLIYMSREIS